MILTITPNPALDLAGVVERITPNEKNYIFNESRYPGGNAVNVARWLTRLRLPVLASGFLGGNVGTEMMSLLSEEGVEHDFVKIKGNTRISITVSDLKTHQQTRLSFQGPRIRSSEIALLKKQIAVLPRESLLIIGGSFPPGFSPSHLNQMIHSAERRKIPIIVDIPGPLLKQARYSDLWLIKPNLSEFHELTGSKTTRISSLIAEAREVAAGVRLVCISSVDGGALLISNKAAWFGKTPKITVKSTVGAGDSMVAAMASVLWKKKVYEFQGDLDQLMPMLLTQALAAAAATLSTPGTALGSAQKMRSFIPDIHVRKID